MHIPDDLPPDLAYDVVQAAQFNGISVDAWVTQRLRMVCDDIADALPHFKATIDYKP